MLRVVALTPGRRVPSARFRVRQHVAELRRRDINVREYVGPVSAYAAPPLPQAWIGRPATRPVSAGWASVKVASRLRGIAASRRADLTWLQRPLLPDRVTLEPFAGHPLVFDVDDAIWLSSPGAAAAAETLAQRAEAILVCNEYLANWFEGSGSPIEVVPTAIDTDRFVPPSRPVNSQLRIGWTGSSSTLPYLEALDEPLTVALHEVDAELVVVCDVPPSFARVPGDRLRFIKWNPDIESTALGDVDIGIMPLPDDEWSRGKCALKMLQYMATGIPCVVSPVGVSADILALDDVGLPASTADEWIEALLTLARDPDRARSLGRNGRKLTLQHFSVNVISEQLARIFYGLV